MRFLALILHRPQRHLQLQLAFGSSLATVALLTLVEGWVLMQLQWDWGYKQLGDPYAHVSVLDFAVCPNEAWGISLVAAYPHDLGHGPSRLIGLHSLEPSGARPQPGWLVSGARTFVGIPGRSQAVVGCEDGSLHIVDASPGWTAPRRLGRHEGGAVDALACSPDGRLLLSLDPECLCGWDLQEERLLWQAWDGQFTGAVYRPSSRSLLCGLGDGALVERDALTGEEIRELARFEMPIRQMDIAQDGTRIVALCGETGMIVYDLPSSVTVWSNQHRHSPVRFSPRGDVLASFDYVLGRGWLVVLWDAETGEEVASMAGHTGMIHGVCFSPDGSLYSWSDDRTIRHWDLVRQAQIRLLPAPWPWAAS